MENHKVEEKNTEKLMFDKNIQKLNDQVVIRQITIG